MTDYKIYIASNDLQEVIISYVGTSKWCKHRNCLNILSRSRIEHKVENCSQHQKCLVCMKKSHAILHKHNHLQKCNIHKHVYSCGLCHKNTSKLYAYTTDIRHGDVHYVCRGCFFILSVVAMDAIEDEYYVRKAANICVPSEIGNNITTIITQIGYLICNIIAGIYNISTYILTRDL